jgi:hypothetical protein
VYHQALFVKWEITDLPIVFHHALHLEKLPGLSFNHIHDHAGFVYVLGVRDVNLFCKIEREIVIK